MTKSQIGEGQVRGSRSGRRPPTGRRRTCQPQLERLETRCLPGFLAPLAFDAGTAPTSVAVGDFNGDGILDLAVAGGYLNGTVNVLMGQGDGTFQKAVSYPAGVDPVSVAVGDFNGDGKLDLAVANQRDLWANGGGVSVLLGKGDGTFYPAASFPAGENPRSVAVGDFNGDGHLDLAAAGYLYAGPDDYQDQTVRVLLGKGDGSFLPAVEYAAGTLPWSVAVGDFNGDGKPDLAVANELSANVSVLLGKGDGSFLPAVNYAAGNFFPTAVAVGDFNGDGKLDLVVAKEGNTTTNGSVSVLLGKGDGTFLPAQSYAAGGLPTAVAVGDFNGDGFPDLAVADQGDSFGNGQGVRVLLGQGDGTFLPAQSYPTGSAPSSVAVGDFNGDGKPDLAVANHGESNDNGAGVSVLLGKGDGSFGAAPSYAAGADPWSVAVGDFNGDGIPDLAVANYGYNGTVSVLLGKGDGSFLPAVNYTVGYHPLSVAVGDFNGDGIQDLAVANQGTSPFYNGGVSVLLGNGDGTFQAAVNYPAGTWSVSVAVGDFNGDGKQDLAVANEVSPGTVSVLLGQGDGTFLPAQTYPTGSAPSSVAVGDFNGDGIPDLAVANPGGKVSVLLGKGDGSFLPAVQYAAGGGWLAVADFNGDGHLDLATGSVLLLGNGDGTFQPAMSHGGGGGYVAVGDFNDDGKQDLAVANSNGVRVLLGNGDGTFQTTNASYVAGGYPRSVAVGDFNGDGWPDLAAAAGNVSILLNDATWSMGPTGAADRRVDTGPQGPAPPSLSLAVAAVAASAPGPPPGTAPREAAPPAPGLAPGLVDALFAAPRGKEPARAASGLVLVHHGALSRTRWQPLFDDLDLLEQARAPLPWEER
jgi:hypothetical protein